MVLEKRVEWDLEKNKILQKERGISFEVIHAAIESGGLLDIIPNPGYAHQQIMVVDINGYIVLTPFVENDEKIFLKTAFLSRKATKLYLSERSTSHGKP